MFGIGMQELVVIIVVALIILGPKKLPGIVTSVRKGMIEFRKALHSVGNDAAAEQEDAGRDSATETPADGVDSKDGGAA